MEAFGQRKALPEMALKKLKNYRYFRMMLPHQGERSLALALPEDRLKKGELHYSDGNLSVYSHVGMRRKPGECQDLSFVFFRGKAGLAGILDGFSELGSVLPMLIVEFLFKTWSGAGLPIGSYPLLKMLDSAASCAARGLDKRAQGGTTAILASFDPMRNYSVLSIGDSACYLLGDGSAKRLLRYNSVSGQNGSEIPLEEARLSPGEYKQRRRLLGSGIDGYGLGGSVQHHQGILGENEALMLASDGITDNLSVLLDGRDEVRDVSGCADLAGLSSAGMDMEELGEGIIGLVERRSGIRSLFFHDTPDRIVIPKDDDKALLLLELK